ncbi:MAG TPA: lipoyl synthase [Elusimicrobiota bacterium]|jgi:lipoic acid synthetase|nr:lipoyl synthase [Elusimicrobiota bacterium]
MSATAPARRLPPWLKVRPPSGAGYERIKGLLADSPLHTVCEEARCPNVAECWGGGTATFMVMGDTCTRGCRFCSVATALLPAPPDPAEPARLAEALARLSLAYAVVTTVCRDDLPDQGAAHVAACVAAAKARCPGTLLEFLAQDFRGDEALLKKVVDAGPDVLSHNLETVERLTHPVRDAKAGYRQSLAVLAAAKRLRPSLATKSSLMLGLGEKEDELRAAFRDLRAVGVDILTLGQYLRPTSSPHHLPVAEFVPPERFEELGALAKSMGFLYVASGPFVRSSYRAGELFLEGMLRERRPS